MNESSIYIMLDKIAQTQDPNQVNHYGLVFFFFFFEIKIEILFDKICKEYIRTLEIKQGNLDLRPSANSKTIMQDNKLFLHRPHHNIRTLHRQTGVFNPLLTAEQ